jgi:hypothetical protein
MRISPYPRLARVVQEQTALVVLRQCRPADYSNRCTAWVLLSSLVTVVVHRHNERGRRGKHGRYAFAYALWRVDFSTIAWVREGYRRRFRIENSYRLLESARGRTSSRDEGWRLWYVVLAVLLLNGWLSLRRDQSRDHRRGASEWRWWNRLLVALAYVLLLLPASRPQGSTPTESQLLE